MRNHSLDHVSFGDPRPSYPTCQLAAVVQDEPKGNDRDRLSRFRIPKTSLGYPFRHLLGERPRTRPCVPTGCTAGCAFTNSNPSRGTEPASRANQPAAFFGDLPPRGRGTGQGPRPSFPTVRLAAWADPLAGSLADVVQHSRGSHPAGRVFDPTTTGRF